MYRVPQAALFADVSTMDCDPKYMAITHDGVHARSQPKEKNVTYYRVDFVAAKLISRPARRFVTEEKAEQHARRVLGLDNDRNLDSQVTIVAVSKTGIRV
jgi:hypothetical protein